MDKPKIGATVRLVGEHCDPDMPIGRVVAVYDRIDVWWDTASGESKVALLDALDDYGPELANSATWYAEVESVGDDVYTGSQAVASFECEPNDCVHCDEHLKADANDRAECKHGICHAQCMLDAGCEIA